MNQSGSKSAVVEGFQAKEFSHLYGLPGFSDELLSNHFKLYQAYVKNTNALAEEITSLLDGGHAGMPAFAELKRRFGWEYNSMKLHELYFENLGPSKEKGSGPGFLQNFMEDFLKTGEMRGIGWVVLYKDPYSGRLINAWIEEHNNGHLICSEPILVLDVFEHAYITDYGLDRKKYLSNFYEQINWKVVGERLKGGTQC